MKTRLWSIVLAAGQGRRLSPVTGGIPKQFWRPAQGQSLLESTLDRVTPLVGCERTVTIVDHSHREHVGGLGASRAGSFLYQPTDRGTAAGVLMALLSVLQENPMDTVVLTPSDHGIRDLSRFRWAVLDAAAEAANGEHVALFGATPTTPTTDYGWIVPGSMTSGHAWHRVARFVEKPPAEMAARLFGSGAMWNTMILVATAEAIRDLYAAHLPDLLDVFDAALSLPQPERTTFLTEVYPSLPRYDFSRDVLTPAGNLWVHRFHSAIGWSDLGTPERFHQWWTPENVDASAVRAVAGS